MLTASYFILFCHFFQTNYLLNIFAKISQELLLLQQCDKMYIINMFLRIIIGLIITGICFTLVWKTESYLRFLGRVRWAEKNLGS